jgi:beta-galactosidase
LYEINKEELAYVRFKYTDNKGTIKPLARGIIRLDVKGGRMLGFGHACPYNEDGYLNDSSDTYYGEALAIIKPEKEKIELVASSHFGVRSTEIRVK